MSILEILASLKLVIITYLPTRKCQYTALQTPNQKLPIKLRLYQTANTSEAKVKIKWQNYQFIKTDSTYSSTKVNVSDN